jgi:hypothetical protein
MTEALA